LVSSLNLSGDLKVVDEVANGLSYYDYVFLRELPRFYAALEDQLASTDPAWDNFELPDEVRNLSHN